MEKETHNELGREDELLCGVQRQEVLLAEQLRALLGKNCDDKTSEKRDPRARFQVKLGINEIQTIRNKS